MRYDTLEEAKQKRDIIALLVKTFGFATIKDEYSISNARYEVDSPNIHKYGWTKRPGIYEVKNGHPECGYKLEEPMLLPAFK